MKGQKKLEKLVEILLIEKARKIYIFLIACYHIGYGIGKIVFYVSHLG